MRSSFACKVSASMGCCSVPSGARWTRASISATSLLLSFAFALVASSSSSCRLIWARSEASSESRDFCSPCSCAYLASAQGTFATNRAPHGCEPTRLRSYQLVPGFPKLGFSSRFLLNKASSRPEKAGLLLGGRLPGQQWHRARVQLFRTTTPVVGANRRSAGAVEAEKPVCRVPLLLRSAESHWNVAAGRDQEVGFAATAHPFLRSLFPLPAKGLLKRPRKRGRRPKCSENQRGARDS